MAISMVSALAKLFAGNRKTEIIKQRNMFLIPTIILRGRIADSPG
jgi:hypothetical protein